MFLYTNAQNKFSRILPQIKSKTIFFLKSEVFDLRVYVALVFHMSTAFFHDLQL
jgi:hypothetical protein